MKKKINKVRSNSKMDKEKKGKGKVILKKRKPLRLTNIDLAVLKNYKMQHGA